MDSESPIVQASATLTLTVNPPPKAALWVTDFGDNLIHSFPLAAAGNARPSATIGGLADRPEQHSAGSSLTRPARCTLELGHAVDHRVRAGERADVRRCGRSRDPTRAWRRRPGLRSIPRDCLYVANGSPTHHRLRRRRQGDAAPVQTISGLDTELDQPMGGRDRRRRPHLGRPMPRPISSPPTPPGRAATRSRSAPQRPLDDAQLSGRPCLGCLRAHSGREPVRSSR